MLMQRPSALLLLALSGAFSLVATTAVRRAEAQQISDADRKAARDLFNEGATLQAGGKYAEALDKFQKSIAVYPAPTTALRIAQCKASMNRLVEATEDYRSIINTALPPGSPPAYQQSKDQAAVELAALDPQVPRVKIIVTPDRISGLQITVDGQPMNAALVGVARPIDPGNHRIVASAPGYAPGEASVTVAKAAQVPEVRIALRLVDGGVTYTNPDTGTGTGTGTNNGGGGTTWNPPPNSGGGSTWTPPSVVPKPQDTQLGIVVGAEIGYAGLVGGGDAFNTARPSFSQLYNGSIGFGVGGGLRFARNFVAGPVFRYDVLTPNTASSTTGGSYQVGAQIAWLGKSDGFGFYAEFGAVYKGVNGTYATQNGTNIDFGVTGFSVLFGAGLHFRAGPIHIIPKVNLGVGKFGQGTGGVYDGTLFDEQLHVSYFVGVTGYYDIPPGDK
ncbi:hypothetical protein BH09MYX1_BH09MYX1_61430 [soil metagenome]